jgi:PqqD family protein of HPr-rel-A system
VSLSLRDDITATPVGDGLVLLDRRSGRYWQLNATGTAILRALLDGAALMEAAQELARRSAVGIEQATADAAALLRQLRTARLVTP